MLAMAGAAAGQTDGNPPFFSASATAYEAQISTAEAGTPLRAGVNVSADQKYVTMGVQASNLGGANLTPFSIAMPVGGGFVGSSGGSGFGSSSAAASILDRPGMTLVSPAGP
jgi:hypothetical protein